MSTISLVISDDPVRDRI